MNLFDQNPDQPKNELKMDKALDFILAGKSTFTIKSVVTGKHFTYKVTQPKKNMNEKKSVHFVKLMTGTDNENNFTFFATVFDKAAYMHSKKSRIGADAQGVRAFRWFLNNLMNGTVNGQVELFHEGCCGRCGRKLTTPESVETGFGPECIKLVTK